MGKPPHSGGLPFYLKHNLPKEQPSFFRQEQPGYTPDFRLFAVHLMKFFSGKPGKLEVICEWGKMALSDERRKTSELIIDFLQLADAFRSILDAFRSLHPKITNNLPIN